MPIVHHLVADAFGAHVGKVSERLKVTHRGETVAQAPLLHLESLTLASSGVSITADAIEACVERGIPVVFMNRRGTVYASLYAAGLVGTVLTRRAQLTAYDTPLGARLAAAFSAGKIRNQSATLRYWARLRSAEPSLAAALTETAAELDAAAISLRTVEDSSIEDVRSRIMGIEGAAARQYWAAASLLLPAVYQWPGRVGRGAADPLNSLLNYGYGILYAAVERALIMAGLDPYAGFLHADRPGKPSLVLDLIEEFRQTAIDRVVVGLAVRGYSIDQDEQGYLSDGTRRDYAGKVLQHLNSTMRYRSQSRFQLGQIIQLQARHLASVLRADEPDYLPFESEG